MKSAITIASIASLLLLAGCLGADNVGKAAPDFTLKDSTGEVVTLESLAGKPVVILFGSIKGCETCIVESKNVLKPLHADVGDQVGFLTVSILPTYESDEDLNRFKQEYGLPWSHARDTDGMAKNYGITHLSTVVVLDSNHDIVYSGVEPSQATIRNALNE